MKDAKKLNLHKILRGLMILCVAGILFSAFLLFEDHQEYVKGNVAYQQIRETSKSAVEQTNECKQKDGIDFLSLKKINPDIVGWITSDGTEIDYPIVQGNDNDDYLHRLFTGESNKMGSIFMDARNHGDFGDKNTIIYGHNMKDGSMFASLAKYEEQSYYNRFPTIFLYTPNGNFVIELFAGVLVNGDQSSIRLDFKDDSDFEDYVGSLKQLSTFKSNTTVRANDRIITLCTCSYEFNNARFALFGKLTPVQ
ncbi:class B sortase [Caproicibacterium sp. NSD3]